MKLPTANSIVNGQLSTANFQLQKKRPSRHRP
jgi:hypothetical protein